MVKLQVGLLFGGRSGEHEVSIRSAQAIAQAFQAGDNAELYDLQPFYIQKDGIWRGPDLARSVLESGQPLPLEKIPPADQPDSPPDPLRDRLWQFPPEAARVEVWFPILHGPNGEDGTVQGLLSLMQVPYVGSGVLGSALGMDKIAMKEAFAQAGLPQVAYRTLTRKEIWSNPCVFPKRCDEIDAALGYPCFVKPANLGSSVGIAKARSRDELEAALDNAASYDRRIIVEAGVEAREVECAVLGNEEPEASVVGEIAFSSDFYDYETKYAAGAAELIVPADLPADVADRIREGALQAFRAVDAAGLARVDFFYLESTGGILVNEINTLPGFTATSMYPRLWGASGVPFPALLDRLVTLALERHPGDL